MPKLSVIVPMYKTEEYLPKCVESILGQSMKDFELILVDDGSPDNCGALCDTYAAKDERVKVIHQANGGISAARNAGLDAAKGEWLSFVDSDDWIERETFAETLGSCDKHNLDMVAFGNFNVVHGERKPSGPFPFDKILSGEEALAYNITDKFGLMACNHISKRALWQGINFPIGRTHEDISTVYKVIQRAKRVGYLHKFLYNYRQHENNTMSKRYTAENRYNRFLCFRERYEFAVRHCPKVAAICEKKAVAAALSVFSSLLVGNGKLETNKAEAVLEFCREHQQTALNFKNKVLLWGIFHCRTVNKIYGHLSAWSKKIRGR